MLGRHSGNGGGLHQPDFEIDLASADSMPHAAHFLEISRPPSQTSTNQVYVAFCSDVLKARFVEATSSRTVYASPSHSSVGC